MDDQSPERGGAYTLLSQAYALEQQKVDFYRSSLRMTRDPGMVKMLTSMNDQEERHCQMLRDLLDRPDAEEVFLMPPVDESAAVLLGASDAEATDLIPILQRIAELESGTAEIYERLAACAVEDEAAHMLRSLADEERKHARWADDRRELESLR